MKKIVIDARELRTSSGRYIERLINYLQEVDKVNKYYLLITPKDINGYKITNDNFHKIPCKYKEFTFSEQIQLLNQINKLKADLVHFTFPQQPVLYRGKTITTILDFTTLKFNNPSKNLIIFKFKQRVFKWVIKRSVKKASQVIVPSNYVKEELLKFMQVNENKISVTYEAADRISDPPESINYLENTEFIMYVGRPMVHKNLNRLIDAFVILKKDNPKLNLVLAGKEDANYLLIKNYVENNKITDIHFTGFVSEAQLRWLYENCRAYIFPSLSEGFGLPGLEAMAHGAAVVSSNATCLPEVYGDAAYYFDPYDVQDMSEKINKVLSDNKLRGSLIEAGYKQVKKYSWAKLAKQTLDLYNKILND